MTRVPLAASLTTVSPLLVALAMAGAQAPAAAPATFAAQRAAPADTLRLETLQADAARRDPRARQLDLLSAQTALRLRSLDAERLPQFAVNGLGQYQSDVAIVPLPGAKPMPHDIYDANAQARARLLDPTRSPRRAVEQARLAESQARVRTAVYTTRQAVNDAFFAALLLEGQARELGTALTDLEAQLRLAVARVREGSALPSESAAIEAELLRRRETLAEVESNRAATLGVLSDLTGRDVSDAAVLALPDAGAEVERARAARDTLRARPEYAQFAGTRELLARQEAIISAQERPRVSAFARAGYGRPGLNPLGSDFNDYWLAGVQLEWNPWSWGTARRDREALALQREIVASDEAAFAETVRRATTRDLASVDRLAGTLAQDDSIVALREGILREARARYTEGVATAAEYVDRETDLLSARMTRASHRVELAQARAHFLTLIGVELP